jgi:hypothetical protein
MRRLWLFALTALLASCATKRYAPIGGPEQHNAYYDRNGDGVVDYELHTISRDHADGDWALVDTKFRGRYDREILWDHGIKKARVDIPVPKNVKITPGKPPKYYAP